MRYLGSGLLLGGVSLLVSLGAWIAPAAAPAATATRVVYYHGYRLTVPASWPVYDLQTDHTACVRFDRHAVYLGRPGADQRCPAHAVGRTEAVLVEPLQARASRAGAGTGQVLSPPSVAGAVPAQGSSTELVNGASGVVVAATWSHHPAVIKRALGVRSLATAPALSTAARPRAAVAAATKAPSFAPRAQAAIASTAPGGVYTGLGFDACATPSSAEMSAWGSSPYRAIGVYIGGANMSCSQVNLTSSWVSQQFAAGWHLIPIYVGLQAPGNSCGCASISSSAAASQGAAAASDAVLHAQAIGLGPGTPLYVDMEGYSRSTSTSATVLAFLASWTSQLHASGYASGVYSSADSGIQDLVSQVGTGYTEPDDIWIASWNGARSTSDPNVPSVDWSNHQRLHQYDGGHNETYGGVTINIDGDYLDGATAAGATVTPAIASLPTLSVSPAADGSVALSPSWSVATAVSSWQVIAGVTPSSLSPVGNPVSASGKMPIVLHSAFAYFAVRALATTGQILGTSVPVATPAHVAIFGQSAFVPRHGMGGLPVQCFQIIPCRLTTTISAGKRTLATTGTERIPPGGGLAYFHLTPVAQAMLARATHHRLATKITVREVSGASATRQLTLISFATAGSGPRRYIRQSSGLRIIGATDFVFNGRIGGILVACVASVPCHTSTTIAAGAKVIARTRPESLGVNELGYLFFSLTPAGRSILFSTRGNQLPAKLTATTGSTTATARIALASFS